MENQLRFLSFIGLYKESPERALNELRTRLSNEIKGIMVHIESEKDYEAIDELRNMINGRFSDDIKFPKIFRDRTLINKLNFLKTSDLPAYEKICSLTLQVKQKAKELNTDYRLLMKQKHPMGWLIAGLAGIFITFPLFIFGNIFNLTFLELPTWQTRKIKDPQFVSSMKYGISLILAFVFLPIYLILSLIIFHPWWLGLLIFFSIPLSGLFGWNYYLLYRRIMGGFRIRNYIISRDEKFELLKKQHQELFNLVSEL